MRLLLVSQEYPPQTARGGIGTQTYAKAHGLAERGHEVCVISHSIDGSRQSSCDGAVRVVRVPAPDIDLAVHTEPVRWLAYSLRVAAAVAAEHAQTPFDLVDFPDWGCEGYIHLLNRTAWNHLSTVVHLHGPLVMLSRTIGWPDGSSELYRIGRHMEQTCLRLADAVFSSSQCSAEWCAREHGLELDRVPILHTGVDTALFRPLDVAKALRPTILFVGRIAVSKGADILLEATCRLARDFPDIQLRMLGRGEATFIERLRQTALRAGCADLLELPGYVPRDQLPAQLSAAHVFAAPSLFEGGPGFVYLEAMACELPVIACQGSGAAEAVVDAQTGLLVPPGDAQALAVAIRHLLNDASERAKLGRQARRHVLQTADSRDCIQRLESFYEAVVQERLCRREQR